MTREEIMALSEDQINKTIAEKLFGYEVVETTYYSKKRVIKTEVKGTNKRYPDHRTPLRNYCSHSGAYEVEEKLKEKKLTGVYYTNLIIAGNHDPMYDDDFDIFDLIHASPIDRLRAALLTLEGV